MVEAIPIEGLITREKMGELLEVTMLDRGAKVVIVRRLEVRRQNGTTVLKELIHGVVMDFQQDNCLEKLGNGFGDNTGYGKLRLVVGLLHG